VVSLLANLKKILNAQSTSTKTEKILGVLGKLAMLVDVDICDVCVLL
jgi:hypothetical protein